MILQTVARSLSNRLSGIAFPHPKAIQEPDAFISSTAKRRIEEEKLLGGASEYVVSGVMKRTIDLVASTIFLILMLPFLLAIAIWIKLDSPGPVIFRQRRVGKDGQTFTIVKFRTMVLNAERFTGPLWAVEDDPRCTRLGKILRRRKIDEMLQVLNVFRGEMSLVGPRPERPFFVNRLVEEVPEYPRRLLAKPGITGLAQVFQNADRNLRDVSRKQRWDLVYLEKATPWLDLKILWRTVGIALNGRDG